VCMKPRQWSRSSESGKRGIYHLFELCLRCTHTVFRCHSCDKRLTEVEKRLESSDREGRQLSERVERLKSEREATAHDAQDKDVQLRSALEKVTQQDSAAAVNDAHLWWAYIWHTLKQQHDSACGVGAVRIGQSTSAQEHTSAFVTNLGSEDAQLGQVQPGNVDFNPPHDTAAAVHLVRLKENLRSQAIEITQLRQVHSAPRDCCEGP
jgi:predicted metal-binding protein